MIIHIYAKVSLFSLLVFWHTVATFFFHFVPSRVPSRVRDYSEITTIFVPSRVQDSGLVSRLFNLWLLTNHTLNWLFWIFLLNGALPARL
ncbi:hypothetical protein [Bathymodiolus heckerae thiotrophic gill symbiont]|uniref:hypothetical protein n=1 Tax=Bathymodiolus heckerae thiotrophic gill symbiont TaxID=1052212 RepID=UPI00148507F5|nr:hypothetical protein [Bathymodiolus heckerae thiotrophic gill symbiont]